MTKTITDIINALPLGTVVVIHFTIGSIEWRTSVSMEGFLGQTLGSRVVKRISRTVRRNGDEVCNIYPIDGKRPLFR